MDNTDKALNKDAGEDASVSATPVEEEKAPVKETEPETEAKALKEAEDKGETKTEEAPKKGAQARIRELVEERDKEREKATSLAQQVEELTKGSIPEAPQAPYMPQATPGAEISPEEYQADVTRTADALVQLRLHQQKIIDRINSESNEAIKLHPELDPDSEHFDKELNETVTEAVLSYVRANPTGSVKEFVNKLMKPYKRSIAKAVGEETEKTVKQVSETALRPTTVPKVEKNYKDMTIEELEAKLPKVW